MAWDGMGMAWRYVWFDYWELDGFIRKGSWVGYFWRGSSAEEHDLDQVTHARDSGSGPLPARSENRS